MTPDMMWTAFVSGLLPIISFTGTIAFACFLISRFVSRNNITTQFPIIFSFSLLGGVMGYSTGNSRTAAVAALLNVVLALVTLLLGYIFGREQIGKLGPIVPYCMICLILCSAYGLFVGAIGRKRWEQYEQGVQHQRLYEKEVLWPMERSELEAGKATSTGEPSR